MNRTAQYLISLAIAAIVLSVVLALLNVLERVGDTSREEADFVEPA